MINVNIVESRDILTKSKLPETDFVINPYTGCPHKCIYCYAEFMKKFANHSEDWGDFIDIKKYDKAINVKKLAEKRVLLSSVTDPYNPYEKTCENTLNILKQFVGADVHVDILTKSSLVTRDIEVLKQINHIRVGLSINTLDDEMRKRTEPNSSSIEERLKTLEQLHKAGITTYVFVSPIFPGLTDPAEIILACKQYTKRFYFENLRLRSDCRQRVLQYITEYHNILVPLYNRLYRYNVNDFWDEMKKDIHSFCDGQKLSCAVYFHYDK